MAVEIRAVRAPERFAAAVKSLANAIRRQSSNPKRAPADMAPPGRVREKTRPTASADHNSAPHDSQPDGYQKHGTVPKRRPPAPNRTCRSRSPDQTKTFGALTA